MKEINGTVTLAFVEEDNKQRVIFRVFPLCTREGEMILGSKELFPDDGSLRIVPDKREQSTFKERMREIGGLCAINLVSDGRELIKVRQNRNYAPDQGERNQQAIYSDVVCEFAAGACFEVVEAGADAANALTPMVLIQNGKLLVGPVAREEAAAASLDNLKPFGDDSFLLHQIETEMLGSRRICWNPDNLLNWRQRRSALRRKERGHADEEQPAAGEAAQQKPVAPEAKEKQPRAEEKPRKQEKAKAETPADEQPKAKAERLSRKERKAHEEQPRKEAAAPAAQPVQEPAPQPVSVQNEDHALPIGERLEILDQDLSFDQQLSRLAQPLSTGANRLSTEQEPVEEESIPETTAHFNGTPLNRNARQITRSVRKPESVHHVVERHMVQSGAYQDDQSPYQMVENPIERLLMDLEYVWQNRDLRQRALEELVGNESFMHDMLNAFRSKGISTRTTSAAQEQLAEIEAERLDLLMQLEMAKENEKKYRENVLAGLSNRLRGESDRLKREVATLEKTRNTLQDAAQVMSGEVAQKTSEYMAQHASCISGESLDRVVLSPVVGKCYAMTEMAENLRQHMNNSGFAISEDEAVALLVLFSAGSSLCLRAENIEDGRRFASLMMESLGLQSVCAVLQPDRHVELVSLLPENDLRTPTVTVQPIGTDTMTVFGHKTVYLAGAADENNGFIPEFRVPRYLRSTFGSEEPWQSIQPASLEAFRKISSNTHPLLSEAEKWFGELKTAISQQNIAIPETTLDDMRCFMEASMRRVRGGFVAAADIAVCHWVAPLLMRRAGSADAMRQVLSGLPRTLELLNIE